RVLDLSYVFAAPYAGGLLADLGAEVIKVEAPHRLDQSRTTFSPFLDNDVDGEHWDRAAVFHVVNRGKRSLALDLSGEEGRDVLRGLVARTDVLLENFTPRVMRGWGMTYAQLAELNPALIMLSNTGFGSTGPWSEFRAQGTTLEATMGLTRHAGYDDGPPCKVGQSYPDFLACWAGLLAIMAALVERERTGLGQWIDLGMYQLGAAVVPEALLACQLGEALAPRGPSAEPDALLSATVRAEGEDRWLAVTAFAARQLRALGEVVGAAPGEDRVAALAAWARTRDAWDAASALQEAGVPAGPVLDARGLLDDPQLRARGFYEAVEFPDGAARALIGRPFRWRGETTSVRVRGCGPRFGEAAAWALGDVRGLDAGRAGELRERGVVADRPVGVAPVAAADVAELVRSGMVARIDEDFREVIAVRHRTEERWDRTSTTWS
ncbi:MAG TPA: CoA transferase, partial [Solirubrobacteraceae bacterium]|nr:CoA transferase [Solirubrobacteraceae bacterium]